MLNFLRGRQDAGPDVYDKRLADYNFSASITHGFPTQPTCLDIDPILNLLAIGEFDISKTVFHSQDRDLDAFESMERPESR
jgi:hypothetical protein